MSTAAIAQHNDSAALANSQPALPFRNDTLLGICEAVGQDLGFHANWLRAPFAALLLWNPPVIVGGYLALGCVVAVTRFFFADRSAPAANGQETAVAAGNEATAVEAVEEKELLAA